MVRVRFRAATVAVALWSALAGVVASACGGSGTSPVTSTTLAKRAVASCVAAQNEAPDDLACTGLYADFAIKSLATGVHAYAPANPMWSDGATKRRFIALAPGAIDTSDPDAWVVPVGTKVWQEFFLGSHAIETRFLWKTAESTWARASYAWNADATAAHRVDDGVEDAAPGYDIPRVTDCDACHAGKKDRLLGFEAVNLGLPGAVGITLESLALAGRLSAPPERTSLALPDGATGRSLEWLHTNCGVSCHNGSSATGGDAVGLDLHIPASIAGGPPLAPSLYPALRTTLGRPATSARYAGATRLTPGNGDASLLLELARTRGDGRMPPVGVTRVDEISIAALGAWIDGLAATNMSVATTAHAPAVTLPSSP